MGTKNDFSKRAVQRDDVTVTLVFGWVVGCGWMWCGGGGRGVGEGASEGDL